MSSALNISDSMRGGYPSFIRDSLLRQRLKPVPSFFVKPRKYFSKLLYGEDIKDELSSAEA
jgi:hypothetical protein